MAIAEYVRDKVVEYFNKAMAKHPEVTKEMLYGGGAIHYMNGNDGTDFDWEWNECVCEFYIFYADEMGYIKVFVKRNGYMDGYLYPNGGRDSIERLDAEYIGEEGVKVLAEILYQEADLKEIWDEPIDKINFSAKLDYSRLNIYDEEEEEEDWWDDEDEDDWGDPIEETDEY